MELKAEVISALRTGASAGISPCRLIDLIPYSSEGKREDRLLVMQYFRVAFYLSFTDAGYIGAAPCFSDTQATEQMVDGWLAGPIAAQASQWKVE